MSLKRFVIREEHFGALVYDRDRKDYIPFDSHAAAVFKESAAGTPIDEIYSKLNGATSEQNFKTFVSLCQSIELLDSQGHFAGGFIDFSPEEISCLSAPLKVHLQITNECLLKCRHCSQESRNPFDNELTFKEICLFIDQLANMGTQELSIGGGEPFLREDLVNIVSYANQKGLSVSLSTSGLFVSRATAKKLSEAGLKQIRISFDGASEKSYDYFRGKGTYRRAIRGIKTLRELFDCPIILHSVIMKPNLGELLSLFKAVQKLEANTWSIDYMLPVGLAEPLTQFALQESDAFLIARSVKRFSEDSSLKIIMPRFPYKAPKFGVYIGFGCTGAHVYCFVNASGDVKACSFMPNTYIAGNIRETKSFREIWLESPVFKDMRNIIVNETCGSCNYYNSCRGGCRARSVIAGNIENVDPLCFLSDENSRRAESGV